MNTASRQLLPLSAAILFTFTNYAQANKTNDDMEVMVVTASGYEQLIKNAPASISVIDREELASRF